MSYAKRCAALRCAAQCIVRLQLSSRHIIPRVRSLPWSTFPSS